MAREHTSKASVPLEKQDDLWALFAVADHLIDDHISHRGPYGDLAKIVEVSDADGKTTEQTLEAARADVGDRPIRNLRFHVMLSLSRNFMENDMSVVLETDYLYAGYDNEDFGPEIGIRVRSRAGEQEAVGLAEVLRKAVEREALRLRALNPPEPMTVADSPARTVAEPPAKTPWHLNAWVVGIGVTVIGGLILAGVIALLT